MNADFQDDNRGQGVDQTSDPMGAEQDFSFAEEKKPVNRNMIALLLIVVLGGALVYFMHARSTREVVQDDATKQQQEKVSKFLADGKDGVDKLEDVVKNTQTVVAGFQQRSGDGQIPADKLKTNPFQFQQQTSAAADTGPRTISTDPLDEVRAALAKAQLQTILYSASGSSCVIDNKICSQGQKLRLGGFQFIVKTINKDSVVLQGSGGEYTLETKARNNLSNQGK